jgi:hypothetical protein
MGLMGSWHIETTRTERKEGLSLLGATLADPARPALFRAVLAIFAVLAGVARVGAGAGCRRRREGKDRYGDHEDHRKKLRCESHIQTSTPIS